MLRNATTSSDPTTNSIADELSSYAVDGSKYTGTDALGFWLKSEAKYPLLAPLAQDLVAAPASEAYVERVFSVCGELTTGKRNRLTKNLEARAFLKIKKKTIFQTLINNC
jgi:hAT family C-terminal dimerisation region